MVAGAIRRRRVPPQTDPYGLLGAMQPYGMKRPGVTGLMGAQQRIQRGPGRPVPRGITKTSEGVTDVGGARAKGPSPLEMLEQGKAAHSTLTGISEGKLEKNIADYFTGVGKKWDDLGERTQSAYAGLVGGVDKAAALNQVTGYATGLPSNAGVPFELQPYASAGGATGAQVGGVVGGVQGSLPPTGMQPLSSSAKMFQAGNVGELGTAQESLSQLNSATTSGAEAASSNMGAYLAYAKIGYDVLSGEGGDKVTGSVFADTVIRGTAAYFTAGMSELLYGFL